MKRVALYVRVSTAEQRDHGLSVDSQIEALTQFAKSNNYKIIGIYNDAGISARKDYKHRPGLLKLIEDCNNSKIDMILFTKLDRWFRSVKDYYQVMDQLGDIPWRAIWEDYETETSAGVFKVNIMLSIAQAEADRTSERVKNVLKYKHDLGQYLGLPPLGYVVENGRLVIDQAAYDGVRAFLVGYADGYTMRKCLSDAAEKGVDIKLHYGYRVLKCPAYHGQTATGLQCPAYLTKEESERFKNRIESRLRASNSQRNYMFQGILKCGYCGKNMSCTGKYTISKQGKKYYYEMYQCKHIDRTYPYTPCPGCAVSQRNIEKLVLENIDDAIKNYAANIKLNNSANEYQKAKADIAKLEGKLRRIGERYEDGDISREEYKEKRDLIKSEISKLSQVTVPRNAPVLPTAWLNQYNLLTDENKKAFWRKTVKCIKVYKHHEIKIEF